MTRLTELTDEQRARIPEWIDRWTAIGLSTEPVDVDRVRAAIAQEYACARLDMPDRVVVCPNPLVMAFAASIAAQLLDTANGSVYDAVGGALGGAVCGAVGGSVDGAVRDEVDDEVDGAVRDAVDGAVRDPVGDAVSRALHGAVRGNWYEYIGGSWWASYPAYYSYFGDVCGVRSIANNPAAQARIATTQECGWWWPQRRFVMVSDRPESISLAGPKARRYLHNDSGMSIRYRDGWGLWHLNGIQVDEQLVLRPETQSIEQIDAERNNDLRAIRMQRYGTARYLAESGASVVDERRNDIEGTHEALLRDRKGDVFLWPTCPANGICPPLRVPKQITTCEQAQRWLHSDERIVART